MKGKTHDLNHDLTFYAHTIKCVCHNIRSMFRVLGIYNFESNPKCNFHHTWYQEERIVIISNVKPFHKTQHISLLHLQKKIWKGHFYWNILSFCIGTIVDISPSYIFTFLSYAMARKERYLRSDQIRKFTYIIAFLNYWNRREKCKVHIFWEDHKILRNLHLTFVLCSASQK